MAQNICRTMRNPLWRNIISNCSYCYPSNIPRRNTCSQIGESIKTIGNSFGGNVVHRCSFHSITKTASFPNNEQFISSRKQSSKNNSADHETDIAKSSSKRQMSKWELVVAVVLERKPIISPEKTPIEQQYSALLEKYEFELSKRNNHEIRLEKDLTIIDKLKSGELDVDRSTILTARDEEDAWTAELKNFKPASRKTVADEKNDTKSLQRALDSHLLLVIKQLIGTDYKWVCPQAKWEQGETLRQTAERALKQFCPDIKAKILGHAPWGVYKYKYPPKLIEGQQLSAHGSKVFFYKAQVISGESPKVPEKSKASSPAFNDYLWLKRDELDSTLLPEYLSKLSEVFIDERN